MKSSRCLAPAFRASCFFVQIALAIAVFLFVAGAAEPLSFNVRLAEANRLLDEGKLAEALAVVKAASLLDTNRFEAPFLAAVIFLELKKPEPARLALDAAVTLAPPAKKAKIQELKEEIDALAKSASQPATPLASSPKLSPAAQRQMDVLMLIIEEADRAKLDTERKTLLREFVQKSEPFLKEYPDQLAIWTLRAVAALELNEPATGWKAGREMIKLGADNSADPKVRRVIAMLDRKGWLGSVVPESVTPEVNVAPTDSVDVKNLHAKTKLLKVIAPLVGEYRQGSTQVLAIFADGRATYTAATGWFGGNAQKIGEGKISNYDPVRKVLQIDWTPTAAADWEAKKLLVPRCDATFIDENTVLLWKRWKHVRLR